VTEPDRARLLHRLLLVDAVFCAGSVVMLLVVWRTVVESNWVPVLAACVTVSGLVMALGLVPLGRGRVTAAVNHMAVANWGISLAVVTLAPFTLPIMVISSLLPALLVVPFVRGELLRRYVAISIVVASAVVALGILQDVSDFQAEMPRWLREGVLLAFTPVMAALVAIVAFQNLAVLAHALEDVVDAQARLVTAFDEARRSIERDLHDGAQQRLTAVAIGLGRVHARALRDGPVGAEELGVLRNDLAEARTELRRLAHGLYPSSLALDGLVPALRSEADRLERAVRITDRMAAAVPAPVEADAYFCCLEAMHNALSHTGPDVPIEITVTALDGELVFTVADSGDGFDPGVSGAGRGLQNMRDRLGAFGGDIEVRSAPGTGTTVTGRVPIPIGSSPARG
jgi:signal transduction histidine kinase